MTPLEPSVLASARHPIPSQVILFLVSVLAAFTSTPGPVNPDPQTWAVPFLVLALFIAVAAPPRRGPGALWQSPAGRLVRAWGLRLAYVLPAVAFGALLIVAGQGRLHAPRAADLLPVLAAALLGAFPWTREGGWHEARPARPTCDPGEADAAGFEPAVRRMQRSTLLAVPVWLASWVAVQLLFGFAHGAIIGAMLGNRLICLAEQRAAVAAETSPWAAVVDAPTRRRRFFGLVALHVLTVASVIGLWHLGAPYLP
ncbi:hypothetical protein L6V77_31670 [Myxococcota bacterium]|nr:hypothetical protein [Myxococcota bacterium]